MANSAFSVIGGTAGLPAASRAEVEAGSTNDAALTPAVQRYQPGVPKGWAQVTGSNTLANGYNVSSVTNHGTGDWSANWTVAFASDEAYIALMRSPGGRYYTVINNSSSTSACRVNIFDSNGTANNGSGATCLGLGTLA